MSSHKSHIPVGPTQCVFCAEPKKWRTILLGLVNIGLCKNCLVKLCKDKLQQQGRWPG